MPTPRPFGAPTTFTPRFTPQGLLQRAQAEVNSQVARMRNLAGRGFGPFPSDGPIGPRPRPTAPVGLPAAGNLLNQIGRGATGIGALMYGTEVLKPFLRSAGILPRTSSGVGSIPPRDRTGESYRDAELRLSAAARAAGGPSAGGGIGGGNAASYVPSPTSGGASGSPAAERAYQSEASRVAQMTAQNPDLQRYEAARGAAKTQEEMNAVRDEGMRIWAAKHGGLAAKVKPGSTGYEAIQGVVGSSAPSALSSEQVQGLMSFDPNIVLNTTQGVQKQFRPNQALTDQEILNAMSFDPNTAMRSAANMAFAPMSSTEAAMLNAVGGAKGEYITPMAATSPLPPLSTQSAQMLREIGGASGEFITPMNANVGLPGVTDQDASKKLFEELLKRAAQNK